MIAAIEPTAQTPSLETVQTLTDLELARLSFGGLEVHPDWPALRQQYDEAEQVGCWLNDVANVNGRIMDGSCTPEPRYFWFNFSNARELAETGVLIQWDLDIKGLTVKAGEPMPSKTEILRHFHGEITDALIRVIAEEAREAALGITYDTDGNPYDRDGRPLCGDQAQADEPAITEATAA